MKLLLKSNQDIILNFLANETMRLICNIYKTLIKMTQYKDIRIKLSDSQLGKSKPAKKCATGVTLAGRAI